MFKSIKKMEDLKIKKKLVVKHHHQKSKSFLKWLFNNNEL